MCQPPPQATVCNKATTPCQTRLCHIFERQVQLTPTNTAIETVDGSTLSYQELNSAADQIRDALVNPVRSGGLGVKPGGLVAILVERGSPTVYAAMLGILKAGCAYLPMDVSFPDSRISFMIEDSGAAALLSSTSTRDIPGLCLPKLVASFVRSNVSLSPKWELSTKSKPLSMKQLCYIIYTSGTTGTPKGVLLSQENAIQYVNCLQDIFHLQATDRVFQGYSTAFDAAFGEVWMAFSSGARLVIASTETMQNLTDLPTFLQEKQITVLDTTPTNLQVMDASSSLPLIHTLIVGGEACPRFVVDRWQPGRRFFNMYGPTETTVSATIAELRKGQPVTIGNPLPGYIVSVRDEALQVVPNGAEGELCIGGPGVAIGYLNRPDKTAERFVTVNGDRLYRTGDLVLINEETKEIVFKGRADGQVKLRGYRVELEEIETAIAGSQGCAQVAVTVQLNKNDENLQELVAFISDSEETPFDVQQARDLVQKALPKYCLPQAFVRIASDAIPRSLVSGKVLRKELPHWTSLERIQSQDRITCKTVTPIATLSPTEIKLVGLFQEVLNDSQLDPTDNLFDLGLTSLGSAVIITRCRKDHGWDFLSMTDVYKHNTIRDLATCVDIVTSGTSSSTSSPEGFDTGVVVSTIPNLEAEMDSLACASKLSPGSETAPKPRQLWFYQPHPRFIRALQVIISCSVVTLDIRIGLEVATIFYWLFGGHVSLLLAAAPFAFSFFAYLQAFLVKKIIVGTFVEADLPMYSMVWLRWWVGHIFCQNQAYMPSSWIGIATSRTLGADIGQGVYLGMRKFPAEADLITIDDGASLMPEVILQPWTIEHGVLKLRRIHIGADSYIGERSLIQPATTVGRSVTVLPMTVLPRGAIPPGSCWEGSPGVQLSLEESQDSMLVQTLKENHGAATSCQMSVCTEILHELATGIVDSLSSLALFFPTAIAYACIPAFAEAWNSLGMLILLLTIPIFVYTGLVLHVFVLAAMKRLAGKMQPGCFNTSSFEFVRWQLGAQTMQRLLYGPARGLAETTFISPILKYGFGLNIEGSNVHVDTSIWPAPDMVHLSKESTVNGGAVIGSPVVHRGRVTLATTTLGIRCFLGNSSVVPQGSSLEDNTLLGVMSCAPQEMPEGTTWLGCPAFELANRSKQVDLEVGGLPTERSQWDSSESSCNEAACLEQVPVVAGPKKNASPVNYTFNPPPSMWCCRTTFNLVKVGIAPTLVLVHFTVYLWLFHVTKLQHTLDWNSPYRWLHQFELLLLSLSFPFSFFGSFIALRYILHLPCRKEPLTVPMYSPYIWLTDLSYELEIVINKALDIFNGSPVVVWIYRALGASIGHEVFLLDTLFMEYELTTIDDGAIITNAFLQTHLYEDRMYKTGRVNIGRNAMIGTNSTILYDTVIGEDASLGMQSVLLRGEQLAAKKRHFGIPSRLAKVVDMESEESSEDEARKRAMDLSERLQSEEGAVAKYQAHVEEMERRLAAARMGLVRARVRLQDALKVGSVDDTTKAVAYYDV